MFSVVIPTYGRKDYLEAAIASVCRQSYQPSEIIVVDNGGAGDRIQPQLSNIIVRHVVTIACAGAAQARNFGATIATNEYVAFLDDDDLWGANYLQMMKNEIDAHEYEVLVGRLDILKDHFVSTWKNAYGKVDVKSLFRGNPGITGSNLVVKKEVFIDLGGFDTQLRTGEDKDFLIKALDERKKIAVISDAQAIFRCHDEASLTKIPTVRNDIFFLMKHWKRLTVLRRLALLLRPGYMAHESTKTSPILHLLFRIVRKLEG